MTEISRNTFKVDSLNFLSFVEDFPVFDENWAERANKLARRNFYPVKDAELINIWSKHKMIAIYTSDRDAHILRDNFSNKPKLITIAKGIDPKHYPSVFGKYILEDIIKYGKATPKVTPKEFIENNNGKYVAVLAKTFNLSKNDIEIWNEFCTNGLFNIWNPTAPYNRLNKDEYQVDAAPYNLETRKYDISDKMYTYKYENQLPDAKILLLRIFKLHENDIFKEEEITINNYYYDTISPRKVRLDDPVISDYEFDCIYSEIVDALRSVNSRFTEEPDCDHGFVTEYGPYNRITGRKITYIPKEERIRNKNVGTGE